MSDEGSGVAQAVIDKMFNQATGKDGALPEASTTVLPEITNKPIAEGGAVATQPRQETEPVTQSTPAAPSPRPPADDSALETVRQTVAALTGRTAGLEAHLGKLELKQNATADLGAAILQLEEKLEAAARRLREIDGHVTTISKKLRDTPSYGVRGDFTCDACGADGLAAIPLKCTNCGREGWWGWWPSHKK